MLTSRVGVERLEKKLDKMHFTPEVDGDYLGR
jgi:hypothetical protein